MAAGRQSAIATALHSARTLSDSGAYEEATSLLRATVREHGSLGGSADDAIGELYATLANYEQTYFDDAETAAELLKRALHFEPRNVAFLNSLALAHLATGDIESLVPVLETIVSIDPERITALVYLAGAYGRQRKHSHEIAIHRRLLALEPSDIRHWAKLSMAIARAAVQSSDLAGGPESRRPHSLPLANDRSADTETELSAELRRTLRSAVQIDSEALIRLVISLTDDSTERQTRYCAASTLVLQQLHSHLPPPPSTASNTVSEGYRRLSLALAVQLLIRETAATTSTSTGGSAEPTQQRPGRSAKVTIDHSRLGAIADSPTTTHIIGLLETAAAEPESWTGEEARRHLALIRCGS